MKLNETYRFTVEIEIGYRLHNEAPKRAHRVNM